MKVWGALCDCPFLRKEMPSDYTLKLFFSLVSVSAACVEEITATLLQIETILAHMYLC
jgi:hypothetical protein